VTAPGFKPGTS